MEEKYRNKKFILYVHVTTFLIFLVSQVEFRNCDPDNYTKLFFLFL